MNERQTAVFSRNISRFAHVGVDSLSGEQKILCGINGKQQIDDKAVAGTENMNRKRNYGLDFVRVIACMMVVAMHAPMPQGHSETVWSLFLSSVSYVTMPCIGLFFMVSGALLLPVAEETLSFLKRRMSKVLCPTLTATAFYLVVKHLNGQGGSWLHEVVSVPFTPQGAGILWFMYVLIGCYLLAPIVSKWLSAPPV